MVKGDVVTVKDLCSERFWREKFLAAKNANDTDGEDSALDRAEEFYAAD